VAVSAVCLALAFVVFAKYLAIKASSREDARRVALTLIALGVYPPAFFLRMGYTESTFLLLLLVAMYSMEKGWHPLVVAFVIGAASATRFMGILLLVPFAMYLWKLYRYQYSNMTSTRSRRVVLGMAVIQFSVLTFVSLWGLLGFMGYQLLAFNEPLAFIKGQAAWHQREPAPFIACIRGLATLEPLWSTYISDSPLYWARIPPSHNALINLRFANPIFFFMSIVAIVTGARRKWINVRECTLAALLIIVPYLLQAPRQGMISEARFGAIAFPIYIVGGHLLAGLPRLATIIVLAMSCLLMVAYTMSFAGGYPLL
jgi:Ca2+/Na+ antiporter